MNNHKERDVDIITVSEFCLDFLRPERLAIQLDKQVKAKPYDIGSWCYSKREPIVPGWDAGKKFKPRKVNLKSLRKRRRDFITKFLDKFYCSGNTSLTLWDNIRRIQNIVDWCDKNGSVDFLDNKRATVRAYKNYTDYLFHILHTEKTQGSETLSRRQRSFALIMEILYPGDSENLKASVQIIRAVKPNIPAPESKKVTAYMTPFVPFIRGLGHAIMNKDFPFKINCGAYDVNVLPCNNQSIVSPFVVTIHSVFNIDAERFYSKEEYLELIQKKERSSSTWQDYNQTIQFLEESNTDRMRSFYRKLWAQKVIRGYASLIQGLTGANPTQLVAFEYKNALDVTSDSVNKELISVKLRANSRVVTYPIGGRKGLKTAERVFGV